MPRQIGCAMRNAVSAAAAMLKAIHAGEDLAAAREKAHPSDREAAWPAPGQGRGAGGSDKLRAQCAGQDGATRGFGGRTKTLNPTHQRSSILPVHRKAIIQTNARYVVGVLMTHRDGEAGNVRIKGAKRDIQILELDRP